MVSAGPLNGHPVDLYIHDWIRFGHKSSLCSFIDTFVLNIWIWLVDLRKMYKCVQPCTYSDSPVYATIFTVRPFETIFFFVNCVPEKWIPKMNHSENDRCESENDRCRAQNGRCFVWGEFPEKIYPKHESGRYIIHLMIEILSITLIVNDSDFRRTKPENRQRVTRAL